MIRGQDVPRPSTLYCRKAPSRHALSFPLLLFFGLTRFVNVQCCAPLDHACSSAFIVCVCVCVCVVVVVGVGGLGGGFSPDNRPHPVGCRMDVQLARICPPFLAYPPTVPCFTLLPSTQGPMGPGERGLPGAPINDADS